MLSQPTALNLADTLHTHRTEIARRYRERCQKLPTGLPQHNRSQNDPLSDSLDELVKGLRGAPQTPSRPAPLEYDLLRECVLDVAEETRTSVTLAEVRVLTAFFCHRAVNAARLTHEPQQSLSATGRALPVGESGTEQAHPSLHEILEQAPIAFCLLRGPAHAYSLTNARYRELLGRQKELPGKPLREALPELGGQDFPGQLDRVYATGEPLVDRAVSGRRPRADGTREEVFFDIVCQPTRDPAGRVDGVAVLAFEVTELVRARLQAEALATENQRALDVLERGDALLILDKDFRLIFVNEHQEVLSRTSRRDTLGRTFWEAFPATAVPDSKFWQEYHRAMRERVPVHFEEYYPPMDVWAEVNAYPTREGGLAVFIRSVTAYKRAEAALRRNEERSQAILSSLAEGIVVQDAKGVLVLANASAEILLGLSCEQMAGRTSADPRWGAIRADGSPYPGEEHPSMVTLRTGQPQRNQEMGIHHPDGRLVWLSVNAVPFFQADGKTPEGVVASFFDITERKQQELEKARLLKREQAARAEAEGARQRIAAILDSLSEPLLTLDREGRLRFLNRPAEQLLGNPRERLVGTSALEAYPFRLAPELLAECGQALHTSGAVRMEKQVPDGRWYDLGACPFDDGLLLHLHDITARKREQETSARAARCDALRADVSTALSGQGTIGQVLQRCAEALVQHLDVPLALLWGIAPENKLLERRARAGAPAIETPDRLELEQSGLSAVARDRRPFVTSDAREVEWIRRTGLPALAGYPLLVGEQLIGVLTLQSARPLPDDVLPTTSAIADAIAQGIERRRAEATLALRAEELARSNTELERFAYVASHDLQEPLRMVASYTQLLARRYKDRLDQDANQFIQFAVDAVVRMKALINDLLTYSRVQSQGKPLVPTACDGVLRSALETLAEAIRESGAQISTTPLPVVSGDGIQLDQLFRNLISNAIKFRGAEPPRVHVTAEARGPEWLFSVRDNGIGIEPQYFERIFIIFQRLHSNDEYPGTGIGLAICKKIVERHGGRIWVESTHGQGTAIFFTLPRAGELGTTRSG